VMDARKKLTVEINSLKARDVDSLSDDEKKLLLLESAFKSLESSISGIKSFERVFSSVEKFLPFTKVDPLGSADTVFLVKSGNLSKVVSAISGFKWTGGSNKTPNGKSESSVGISDSLLEKLMNASGASGLLVSWLQSGDREWKKWVDSEIKKREAEIKRLSIQNSGNPMIHTLKSEIARLGKDWKL
ncbi:hypothetical protein KJ632_00750, partial [Patescibacteria group bacterium]|nr:hypothetical protein [Patescibacteria group bacterium]